MSTVQTNSAQRTLSSEARHTDVHFVLSKQFLIFEIEELYLYVLSFYCVANKWLNLFRYLPDSALELISLLWHT